MAKGQQSAVFTPANSSDETTSKVLAHHLGAFAQGVDEILADYLDASVLITPDQTFHGVSEIRGFFQAFVDSATPEFWEAFKLGTQVVHNEVAYITWWAKPAVTLATDTFIVRNGKILVQTFTAFTA